MKLHVLHPWKRPSRQSTSSSKDAHDHKKELLNIAKPKIPFEFPPHPAFISSIKVPEFTLPRNLASTPQHEEKLVSLTPESTTPLQDSLTDGYAEDLIAFSDVDFFELENTGGLPLSLQNPHALSDGFGSV